MGKRTIFGVCIDNISFEEAVENIKEYLEGETPKVIYTPNTEIVMAAKDDESLKNLINTGNMVTADGIGLIYAGKIKNKPIKERVTGYDLSMSILDIANQNKYSLYLLGGKPGVSELATKKIKSDYSGIKIAGEHHGYFKGSHNDHQGHQEELDIIEEINHVKPDIIFVGLGFPGQEKWIDSNRVKLKSKLIIGNGGVIDILAGNAKRAPDIFIKLGLEWFYRLLKEPSRIKRQIVLPKFMLKVIFSKDVIN